jgi:hypothetical protein
LIEPDTTTLRANVDFDAIGVFWVELARALWTGATALWWCVPAMMFSSLRKRCPGAAVNRFPTEPESIAVAASRKRDPSLVVRLQEMTVVGTP